MKKIPKFPTRKEAVEPRKGARKAKPAPVTAGTIPQVPDGVLGRTQADFARMDAKAATRANGKQHGEARETGPHANPGEGNGIDLLSGFDGEDVGNAQRIIKLHGERLRYCHAFCKWLVWDGRRWRIDETGAALLLAQQTIIEFATQAVRASRGSQAKFAVRCLHRSRITNALALAESWLPVLPADLDTHPDLLNFRNGTLNLRTRELLPHSQQHFITKLIYYDYQPDAECPTFLGFLHRIMGNHPDVAELDGERCDRMVVYLQCVLGYSLTGYTSEKAVFLFQGRTDTGKTTLLSLFRGLLSEYAVKLQIDTLMARPQESNNTQADLADLRGARFAMTSETEKGQRLSEGKLKRITQGMGTIKAVRKFENPFEFPETHKLFIDANHLPVIRGTDDSIWNRLHQIPFDVRIPKDEQDIELPRKLEAEGPGILAWAAAGAARWYEGRIKRPAEVQAAGAKWRRDSDQIGRFIDEMCVKGDYAQARARPLYQAYKKWAEEAGEHAIMSGAEFSESMEEREFRQKRDKHGLLYLGVGLAAGDQSQEDAARQLYCNKCSTYHASGMCTGVQ
jgi:putative DNA primase/helicase